MLVSDNTACGDLPKLTQKIVGHCVSHPDEVAFDTVLWKPSYKKTLDCHQQQSYSVPNALLDRKIWTE